MPSTRLCFVRRSNEPLARTSTLPTQTPCLVPVVTVARTSIPGLTALDFFAPLGLEHGKPRSLTVHFCLHPCPVAVMSNGTTPDSSSLAGVLLPTQAASIQCCFGKPRCVRLYFVSPPDPLSSGEPSCLSRS